VCSRVFRRPIDAGAVTPVATISGAARRVAPWFVALIVLAGLFAQSADAAMRRSKLTLQTGQGAHVIEIEIAMTPAEQQMGLMFRRSVPENTGMLFLYPGPQEITMWMKDTYVSLDMVFIKGNGVVHRIEAHTEPFSQTTIPSKGDVVAVLEMVAGSAEKLGLKPGDRVVHAAFAQQRGKN
jgi:uncharacterized membrane protein (UPF0127 family)